MPPSWPWPYASSPTRGDSLPSGQTAVLTRILAVSVALVEKHVGEGDLDTDVEDEAVIRLSAYLFDTDPVRSRGNAMVNSGCAHLIDQFRTRRSAVVEEDDE